MILVYLIIVFATGWVLYSLPLMLAMLVVVRSEEELADPFREPPLRKLVQLVLLRRSPDLLLEHGTCQRDSRRASKGAGEAPPSGRFPKEKPRHPGVGCGANPCSSISNGPFGADGAWGLQRRCACLRVGGAEGNPLYGDIPSKCDRDRGDIPPLQRTL